MAPLKNFIHYFGNTEKHDPGTILQNVFRHTLKLIGHLEANFFMNGYKDLHYSCKS